MWSVDDDSVQEEQSLGQTTTVEYKRNNHYISTWKWRTRGTAIGPVDDGRVQKEQQLDQKMMVE